ncbi:hypothetical protein BP6252_01099 [Coleophoma cylindrospora]|uniref:Uncharacterized protein n=1 Tax=Coleophoma cylindrospora TaxID=1849047 RepID=A0A3D8SRY4_9HELO|nr:hypothetical protein BP6252_01099 [Coleophoma cylindrospora]
MCQTIRNDHGIPPACVGPSSLIQGSRMDQDIPASFIHDQDPSRRPDTGGRSYQLPLSSWPKATLRLEVPPFCRRTAGWIFPLATERGASQAKSRRSASCRPPQPLTIAHTAPPQSPSHFLRTLIGNHRPSRKHCPPDSWNPSLTRATKPALPYLTKPPSSSHSAVVTYDSWSQSLFRLAPMVRLFNNAGPREVSTWGQPLQEAYLKLAGAELAVIHWPRTCPRGSHDKERMILPSGP